MAKDPDDIVLQILRDIQKTLAGHSTEFRKIHGELMNLRNAVVAAAGIEKA